MPRPQPRRSRRRVRANESSSTACEAPFGGYRHARRQRAAWRSPKTRDRPATKGLAARKLDRERRALADRRPHRDAAVHPLDELLADVEAEARSGDAARLFRVEPVELLEDPFELSERDA